MKLQDQVCSLELAKKLNELGVKQESLFYWGWCPTHRPIPGVFSRKEWIDVFLGPKECGDVCRVCSFTVAELGEMLPWSISFNDDKYFLSFGGRENPQNLAYYPGYEVSYSDEHYTPCLERASSEADARAAMLIYLIENKLITL